MTLLKNKGQKQNLRILQRIQRERNGIVKRKPHQHRGLKVKIEHRFFKIIQIYK